MGFNYDPWEEKSFKTMREVVNTVSNPKNTELLQWGFPMMRAAFNFEPFMHLHENFGPIYDNYDYWLRGIKKIVDPNNIGDWGCYCPTEYPKIDKVKDGQRPNNPDEWGLP